MEKEKTNEKSQGLSKVLGPMHIWALGVGIVLVGEFMGWNFTVAKGGSIGSVIALWTVAMLYVMIVMMNTEMGSVMPEAGGQIRIYDRKGHFMGIYSFDNEIGRYRPVKLFFTE